MTALLVPLALAVVYALVMLTISVGQTRKALAAKSRPLHDDDIGAQTARLARALDLPHIPVNVYETEAVNGLAAPDGQIYLTRGFLQRKQRGEVTAEELAAVIAHELGHVALGHMRRRMIDFTGQNAVFVMLSAVLNRFLPIVGVWIANLISAALMARLSRRDEFEADAWAAALLTKAGIGTGPQKSLFRKLTHLAGMPRGEPPAWLMSHPRTKDRIAAIEAMERRWAAA
jgi:putative metalloprotease